MLLLKIAVEKKHHPETNSGMKVQAEDDFWIAERF